MFVSLSLQLSVCLSLSLSLRLFVYLSLCLSVSLSCVSSLVSLVSFVVSFVSIVSLVVSLVSLVFLVSSLVSLVSSFVSSLVSSLSCLLFCLISGNNSKCSSTNLFYVIKCSLCNIKCVGKTGDTIRNRMNRHRSNIRLNQNTPVAIHFNSANHNLSNLTVTPIELIAYLRMEKFKQ